MTLITVAADGKQVGLHALLIGVGAYPHLDGGASSKKFSLAEGMTQLTSPYHSVDAFALWLKDKFTLGNTPLRSLRVLASSPDGHNRFDPPTIQAIKDSVEDWFSDADLHEDNFTLFYFCGHGLLIGNVTALLAQDFGRSQINPFEHSFDPQKFESGMLGCRAARQLFVVDACSNASRDVLARYPDINPSPLVQPTGGHHRLGVTKQSEIRASELGTAAFGQTNRPSVFMESFLDSMRGAAAIQDGRGRWVVKTTPLRIGVDWLVQRSEKKEQQLVGFGPGVAAEMVFHELQSDPIVPVKVICEPEAMLAQSSLDSTSGHSRLVPSAEAWHFDVPLGAYEFSAKDQLTGNVFKKTDHASPQYKVVAIRCKDAP